MTFQKAAKEYSWIPAKVYVRLSGDHSHIRFFLQERSYSVSVETLLELIAGHIEFCRIFILETPGTREVKSE